jgi:branched-chain amino acid transport system permease protein
MDIVIPLAVSGLERGAAYALIAVGFTVIFASTQVLNFAQGEFLMVGAMLGFAFFSLMGLPVGLALLLAVLAGGLLGLILDRLLINPLENRGASKINTIIATLAFGLVASQGFGVGISRNPEPVPSVLSGPPIVAGPVRISQQGLVILAVTTVIAVALWWFFSRTDVGMAVRAIGYNREGAMALGLNVSVLVAGTLVVSGAIAAIAGVLVGAVTGASAYMGLTYGVKGFAGAVLGGLGNPIAAVIGGLSIGILESFGQFYLPHGYGAVLPYVVLIGVLLVRPGGLFPEVEIK